MPRQDGAVEALPVVVRGEVVTVLVVDARMLVVMGPKVLAETTLEVMALVEVVKRGVVGLVEVVGAHGPKQKTGSTK